MSKIIKNNDLIFNTKIYLLSNIISASIPFALLPILTRNLSTSEYGIIAIFQSLLAGFCSFVGISSQGAASIKYYHRDIEEYEQKYYIGNCILILLITTVLSFIFAMTYEKTILNWLHIDAELLYISILIASFNFIITIRMSQWQTRKQSKYYGIFQVAQNLFNFSLSIILVIYYSLGFYGRVMALCITPIFFSAIALHLLHKDKLLGFAWRPQYLREIFIYGIPLIPHTTGYFLLSSVDRLIINNQLGMTQVGIYMVAFQLTSAMSLVFDALNNAYVPWLFERLKLEQIRIKYHIVNFTYLYWIGLIAIAIIAFLIGPTIIMIIAGEKYKSASEIIGWLALGQVFHGMYLMVTNYILYSKRTGLLSFSTLSAGLVNICLLILLIPIFKLKGAAIAFAISMGIKFLLTWIIAQHNYPMPWSHFKTQLSK